jgi:hypothetical protein
MSLSRSGCQGYFACSCEGEKKVPAPRKPAEQLRRRNRPEQWTVLPADGCKLPAPKWPLGTAAKGEADLWKRLWALPLAAWWHEQRIEPAIVARYVVLAIGKPSHASVSKLESDLGLTPAAMLRMRLAVEHPEPVAKPTVDPYRHLRVAQ